MKSLALAIALLCAGCGLNGDTDPVTKQETKPGECSWANLGSAYLDGHLFAVNYSGGIVHHPDCPCGRGAE